MRLNSSSTEQFIHSPLKFTGLGVKFCMSNEILSIESRKFLMCNDVDQNRGASALEFGAGMPQPMTVLFGFHPSSPVVAIF